MYFFSRPFKTFPGLLVEFFPPAPPLGWGGANVLGSNHFQIFPHMHAKCGRGPTVVSTKSWGTGRQTGRQADIQTDIPTNAKGHSLSFIYSRIYNNTAGITECVDDLFH